MASTYSTSLRIELQGSGENSGTWGTITNNNFSQSLEFSIAGIVNVACGDNAVTTLTNADCAAVGESKFINHSAQRQLIRVITNIIKRGRSFHLEMRSNVTSATPTSFQRT